MDSKFRAYFGVGAAGLFVLIAGQGAGFLEVLKGIPLLVQAWTAGLPFGAGSFLLSVAFACGVWGFATRWLHGRYAQLAVETITLLSGVAVTLAQQWTGTPGQRLTALIAGMIAGFMAPYVGKLIAALLPKTPPT